MLVSRETEQPRLAGANLETGERRRSEIIDDRIVPGGLHRHEHRDRFKPEESERCHIAMKLPIALSFALLGTVHPHPALKPQVQYTLRVDSADLSGWTVAIRLRTTSATFRLAMAAHPEYDDRYWRFVKDIDVEPVGTVTRVDSAIWQVDAP